MLRHARLGNNNGCTRNYAGGARAARANVKQGTVRSVTVKCLNMANLTLYLDKCP